MPNPDGEMFAIRVRDVATGGALSRIKVPSFPEDELGMLARSGKEALVALTVGFDGGRKPVSLEVAEGSPLTTGEFVRRAKRSTKSWTYVPEILDGVGVPGKVVYFFCVFAHVPNEPENIDGPDRCRWNPPVTRATLGNNESLALDSGAYLKTEVAERIL